MRNKEEKIQLIYNTFFDLVLKNGYDKVSTNHIAEGAGISIGIIYKYFPNGKPDIIRKFFEKSKDTILNLDDFMQFNEKNIDIFEQFITRHLNYHKDDLGYNLAFRSAIQSDTKLLEDHKQHIYNICAELVKKLRESNEFFKSIPENRLVNRFVLIYNLIDGLIYHHLFIMRLFDKDNDLIEYLSNMLVFTINYFRKKRNLE